MSSLLDFQQNTIWLNFSLFGVAAGAIWYAGARLERESDTIAVRTGLGHAFIGVLLLATSTGLPEIAAVTSASLVGNPALAVHNLLGAVVINMLVLAIADAAMGRKALSHQTPKFVLLIQGVGLVFVLAVALVCLSLSQEIASRELVIGTSVSVATLGAALLASYLLMLYLTYRSQHEPRWHAISADEGHRNEDRESTGDDASGNMDDNRPLSRLGLSFAGAALIVLFGGITVGRAGDALAQQTGLGDSYFGFTLMALSTTLPEMSTTVAAARAGRYETAFATVFGSGAFNVALLILVGVLSGPANVVHSITASAQFAAAMGVSLTSVYLWGLLEREDRTVVRLGWDSVAVVVLVLAGNLVMFMLR